jgi:tight adherence protein B
MLIGILLGFAVVFALVLVAVSVGMKYYETRRKKQVTDMLQTVAGPAVGATTKLLKDLEPAEPTFVQRMLNAWDISDRCTDLLQRAGMSWSPAKLLGTMWVASGIGLFAGSVLAPASLNRSMLAAGLALAGGAAPYFYVRRKARKRMAEMEEQLPEALDFLARSMRAGHAFTISLEMLGEELPDPLGQEFRALFNEQNLGAPIDIALRNFALRVPLLDARFFCSAVLLQRQTGGNLSEILARLSYLIRERFRLRGQVKAASSHGRMTAGVLSALPIITVLGLMMVAPGYLNGMAADPDGRLMIAGAVVGQILGHFSIKRIVNIKV